MQTRELKYLENISLYRRFDENILIYEECSQRVC